MKRAFLAPGPAPGPAPRLRRAALLAVLLPLLAGCEALGGGESDSQLPESGIFTSLRGAIATTTGRGLRPVLPRYAALLRAGVPGQIAYVEEKQAYDLSLREQVAADGTVSWLTQDGSLFAMRDGILVATRGLGGDIMSTDARQSLALLRARRPGIARRFVTDLDGNHGTRQTTYVCEIAAAEEVTLDLAGGAVASRLMSETCHGGELGFLNLYWVDGRGEIRQSRQFAGRLVGMVAFREVPPAVTRDMQATLAAGPPAQDSP